jgi:hypothetical protein
MPQRTHQHITVCLEHNSAHVDTLEVQQILPLCKVEQSEAELQ